MYANKARVKIAISGIAMALIKSAKSDAKMTIIKDRTEPKKVAINNVNVAIQIWYNILFISRPFR